VENSQIGWVGGSPTVQKETIFVVKHSVIGVAKVMVLIEVAKVCGGADGMGILTGVDVMCKRAREGARVCGLSLGLRPSFPFYPFKKKSHSLLWVWYRT
jgi:hypothetical protein